MKILSVCYFIIHYSVQKNRRKMARSCVCIKQESGSVITDDIMEITVQKILSEF